MLRNTEVYKPYGTNLFYYDVNSLYPYVALQDMPGLVCKKVTYLEDEQDIDMIFGFFYCSCKAERSLETPLNGYLGLLPIRTNQGLHFPLVVLYHAMLNGVLAHAYLR